jgi:hypothetical protein
MAGCHNRDRSKGDLRWSRCDGTRSEVAPATANPQLKSIAEVLLAIAMERFGQASDKAEE